MLRTEEATTLVPECAGGRGDSPRDAEGSGLWEQHTPARGWCHQQSADRYR